MSSEAPELLFLNVAKIVEFTQGGIDGIVNAICFGCMVGNASAAVIEHIRAAHHDIPSSQWSAPAARSPPGS